MLWCFAGILKFLQIFGQGTPHFHFALSSTNCVVITAPLSIVTIPPFLLPALSLFFFFLPTPGVSTLPLKFLSLWKNACALQLGDHWHGCSRNLQLLNLFPIAFLVSVLSHMHNWTSNTQLAPNSTVVPLVACNGQLLSLLYLICFLGDFPGGQGVKTLHFQCRGHRFDPWSGN